MEYYSGLSYLCSALKKIFAILAVTIYLMVTTQVGQLLKLPLLVEHYFEHKRIDKCITFLEFMQMHYLKDESNNPDYARDMQLPFKTVEVNSIISFVLMPMFEFQLFNLELNNYSSIIASYQHWHPGMFFDPIWQPPKSIG